MFLLVSGLVLWWAAHFWKRLAPSHRARFGVRGKALVALALAGAVALMILGYKSADATAWWSPTPMLKGVNNLIVLASFYLFAASGAKTAVTARLRHPQLVGFALWAGAHVMVNGHLPSFVLFGGLLAWALAEIVVINRADPERGPAPVETSPVKEAVVALAALAAFAVVGWLHGWLGPRPWG